jgi:excinuclease ABC subunit B
MERFRVQTSFKPEGDQPEAIRQLTESLEKETKFQTLLGVTGSGKTFTMAKVIENLQKPALIISHNKTLSAQLYREFKTFFPDNAVEYFVSYYDYYQPESYVPQKDLYIEKDASINEELDSLRLRATTSLIERRDVIIVASVSSIYGLGSPDDYKEQIVRLEKGKDYSFDEILERLVRIQYARNNVEFVRATFRQRGEFLDIFPAYENDAIRVEFFDRTVENIYRIDPLTNEIRQRLDRTIIYPAKHFITPRAQLERAVGAIKQEMEEQERMFREKGKLVEAHRIRTRTLYDMEMLQEMGYCPGVENYSRHLTGRPPGSSAATLLSYFPGDFLTFIDESHVTVPQLKGMYRGDRARKQNLVDFGFRLPSAYDNRPLYFEEFLQQTKSVVFVSATPADFERQNSTVTAEQLIRPTGLIDPEVSVRPSATQVQDLLAEAAERVKAKERVLVTTLTKKMAEELAAFMLQKGIKCKYLHSEIETFERVEIIRDLRKGVFDVLIGVNLLREGLDLPEVSLVAVLDADKEGFLRSQTSLIQTSGRAARNINGKVILYADTVTESIRRTVEETARRREKQTAYNREHGITPQSIRKDIVDILERDRKEALDEVEEAVFSVKKSLEKRMKYSDEELKKAVRREIEKKMFAYADNLEFEKAAYLRDYLGRLDGEAGEREEP